MNISIRLGLVTLSAASLALGLALWEIGARAFASPILMPSFLQSMESLAVAVSNGDLLPNLAITMQRVLLGFALGLAVGTPLGLLMGQFAPLRWMVEPFVNFFRFVTPIALLTLIIVWAGSGDESKIILVAYVSGFILLQNALRGVLDIDPVTIRAARALGASEWQRFWHVTVPASLGAVLISARIAFGYAFMTIIAAEIIVNDFGIGYLIWTSQLYSKTALVFASLILLGVIGLIFDWGFGLIGRRAGARLGQK